MSAFTGRIPCSYCDQRAVVTIIVAEPTAFSREHLHMQVVRDQRGNVVSGFGVTKHVEDRCLRHLSGIGRLSDDARREAEAHRRARGAA